MTNKELFVEYLKYNNFVPQDYTEADLPNWDMLNMDTQQPWQYYGAMPQYPMDDIAIRRPWNNRPDWRGRPYVPEYGPGYGPGFYRPNWSPLLWWWLLFS